MKWIEVWRDESAGYAWIVSLEDGESSKTLHVTAFRANAQRLGKAETVKRGLEYKEE